MAEQRMSPTGGTVSRRRGPANRLRLVGDASHPARTAASTARQASNRIEPRDQPQLTGPSDPRWVLAVRVAQELEGTILRPERRAVLIKLGRTMGLSPFDANLIIAIVQDQARRGYEPDYCPTAGEQQLAMIPSPSARQRLSGKLADQRFVRIALIVAAIIAAELLLVKWLFF